MRRRCRPTPRRSCRFYRDAKYMLDVDFAPLFGALVITNQRLEQAVGGGQGRRLRRGEERGEAAPGRGRPARYQFD